MVFGNQFGACPSGPPQDPDDPPPQSNIQRDHSLALAKILFPHLNSAQLEAQAAQQYSDAATRLLVTVLQTARATRPACHWGYWGSVGLCQFKRPCAAPPSQSASPAAGAKAAGGGTDWMRCGLDHPTEGARLWAIAEQQRPIWAASDALFPDLYPLCACSYQPLDRVANYHSSLASTIPVQL